MALLLTSNSLARSLIRILCCCIPPFRLLRVFRGYAFMVTSRNSFLMLTIVKSSGGNNVPLR